MNNTILRNPRLVKQRVKLVRQSYYKDGFFLIEIAGIFKMPISAISKIINESKVGGKSIK